MKALLKILLAVVLQIVAFTIIYNLGYSYGMQQPEHQRIDKAWGISLKLATVIFCVLSFLVAIYVNMVSKITSAILVVIVATIVFSLFWIKDITYLPYRTSLLLISALVGFSSSIFIKLLRNTRKDVSGECQP